MKKIKKFFRESYWGNLLAGLRAWYLRYSFNYRKEMGYCDETASIVDPIVFKNPKNMYVYDHTIIRRAIIMTPEAKFIMKRYSGAGEGLVVLTGNHDRFIGRFYRTVSQSEKTSRDQDVIIEEDCWIGVNVTLCAGVTVGRGATIGAGSVVRNSVPPYAVAIGNPAKVVGFCFTPDEIIKHEEILYDEGERLSREILEKNYEKYFVNRIKDIKQFVKL